MEEICWPCRIGTSSLEPSSLILDSAWGILSSATAERTAKWVGENADARIPDLPGNLRAVALTGLDGVGYLVAANFGPEGVELPAERIKDHLGSGLHLSPLPRSGRSGGENLQLRPFQTRVWRTR